MDEELVEWMNYGDDQILELLQSEDVFTPDHVAEEVPIPATDVAVRCRTLAKHGLLKKYSIGMYEVTALGDRVVAGEADPEELAVSDGDGDTDTNTDSDADADADVDVDSNADADADDTNTAR